MKNKIVDSIKSFISMHTWEKIGMGSDKSKLPKWVISVFHKQFNKNYYRGNKNPYDKKYYFKGKTFEYKIVVLGNVQGGSYYYYRKLRKI